MSRRLRWKGDFRHTARLRLRDSTSRQTSARNFETMTPLAFKLSNENLAEESGVVPSRRWINALRLDILRRSRREELSISGETIWQQGCGY